MMDFWKENIMCAGIDLLHEKLEKALGRAHTSTMP